MRVYAKLWYLDTNISVYYNMQAMCACMEILYSSSYHTDISYWFCT